MASCVNTSHRADNEICDPAALEPFNTTNPSDVGSTPSQAYSAFLITLQVLLHPVFTHPQLMRYGFYRHATRIMKPQYLFSFVHRLCLVCHRSSVPNRRSCCNCQTKGVSFPETKPISGGQLPGMWGQFETEWGVSLVRNSQPALCFLRAGGNLLLQPRATLRIVLSFEASVFVFFYQF